MRAAAVVKWRRPSPGSRMLAWSKIEGREKMPASFLVRKVDYAVALAAGTGLASGERWLNGRVACLCPSRIPMNSPTQHRAGTRATLRKLLLPNLLSGELSVAQSMYQP